ncbi:uncharacterized protein FIBRA_05257 [Fibroporia radiculosa]|uniref:Uncharacterized protein n=1 Tax=Fibroporia radiculosa TaxID=599839 RepID=J4IAL8_9APHY|nr:uncharacterized protein FIBRA_05257 [Fibroporia radiculosa]CCM03136.1 predicted protein [Fibroporia radiculosa]
MAQAALVYGTPSMAAVAGSFFVFQVWSTFYTFPEPVFWIKLPRVVQLIAILSPPYVILVLFVCGAGLILVDAPSTANAENGIYCVIDVEDFQRLMTPAFCAAVLVVITVMQVAIAVKGYRGWRHIKNVFPEAEVSRLNVGSYLRVSDDLYMCDSLS